MVNQRAAGGCDDFTSHVDVAVADKLRQHFGGVVGSQLDGLGDTRVVGVTGGAVAGGIFTASDVVIDAVGLNLPLDVGIFQAEGFQAGGDGGLFFNRVGAQFSDFDLSAFVGVEGGQDFRGVVAIGQISGFQVGFADGQRAAAAVVDPVEGSDEVIWGEQFLAVDVGALHQHGLVAGDEVGRGAGASQAATEIGGCAVGFDHRPVNGLDGRGIHLRDVAGFAGDDTQVLLGIGQPVTVRFCRCVAGFAAAHGALVFGRNGELGTLPAREVVVGHLQVLADFEFARVVGQVVWGGPGGFLRMNRVVERVMAVGAFQGAFGVDVPGAGQRGFVGQVNARLGDFLRGDDLAGGGGLRIRYVAGRDGQGFVTFRVNFTVTGGAVGVGGVLNQDKFGLEFAILAKGGGVVGETVSGFIDQAGANQSRSVGEAKFPGFDFGSAGGGVGLGEMAEETVHFHRAGCLPVPRFSLTSFRVQEGGFRVGRVAAELIQGCTRSGGRRRPAARNPFPIFH